MNPVTHDAEMCIDTSYMTLHINTATGMVEINENCPCNSCKLTQLDQISNPQYLGFPDINAMNAPS